VLTSENEPKPDIEASIEAKQQAIRESWRQQRAARSARLKAAKEGVGAAEGAAASTSTSTRGNEGRPAAASEAKSREQQETQLSGSRLNKVKRTTWPSTFAEVVQNSAVDLGGGGRHQGTNSRVSRGSSLLSGHKDMAGTPGNPVPGCTVFWMVEILYWNHSNQQLCSSSFHEKRPVEDVHLL
jgi:hypothetical protein